jgi:hypothetical protein
MGVDSLWSQTDNGENLLNQQEKFTSIRMGNLPALCQMSKKRQGYIVVNLKKTIFRFPQNRLNPYLIKCSTHIKRDRSVLLCRHFFSFLFLFLWQLQVH